LAVTPRSGAN